MNTATEQGITGEVMAGNDMPRANENIGYIKGNINKIMDNGRCLPVLSKVVYPLIVSHNPIENHSYIITSFGTKYVIINERNP